MRLPCEKIGIDVLGEKVMCQRGRETKHEIMCHDMDLIYGSVTLQRKYTTK
jgi:hypothetical protein